MPPVLGQPLTRRERAGCKWDGGGAAQGAAPPMWGATSAARFISGLLKGWTRAPPVNRFTATNQRAATKSRPSGGARRPRPAARWGLCTRRGPRGRGWRRQRRRCASWRDALRPGPSSCRGRGSWVSAADPGFSVQGSGFSFKSSESRGAPPSEGKCACPGHRRMQPILFGLTSYGNTSNSDCLAHSIHEASVPHQPPTTCDVLSPTPLPLEDWPAWARPTPHQSRQQTWMHPLLPCTRLQL
jgi:hypothetical protein